MKYSCFVAFSFFEKKLPIIVIRDVCASVCPSVVRPSVRQCKYFLFAVIRFLIGRLISQKPECS